MTSDLNYPAIANVESCCRCHLTVLQRWPKILFIIRYSLSWILQELYAQDSLKKKKLSCSDNFTGFNCKTGTDE